MTAADAKFIRALLRELCERARRDTLPRIESKTLRDALRCRDDLTARVPTVKLTIPHYWAVYYHDGRGPITARRGKFLVYFQSIEDDPRVQGGRSYPERASQIRRLNLSRDEFTRLRKQGKLVVRRSVGPQRGRPFFAKLEGFQGRAAPIVRRRFSGHVKAQLADVLKATASVTL